MRKPAALRPGDRIAVVAPASPFPRDDFERGLAELARLGFEPVFDARVFERQRYLAGGAAVRAASLFDAWMDPGVSAVVAARGGYGSVQVLPLLDLEAMAARPKVFVGCSDLTAILSVLGTRLGVTAVHGAMTAGQMSRGAAGYDEASWLAAVTGVSAEAPLGEGLEVLAPGIAAGPLFGGNLTQLAASLGTPYAFDPPEGCVLFLEDVGERPYRVDRLLTQLRLAGVLARARALVFGEMLGCDEPDGSLRSRDVLADAVRGFDGPVVFGLAAGHTSGPALSLPLGVAARVEAGDRGVVTVLEAAVER